MLLFLSQNVLLWKKVGVVCCNDKVLSISFMQTNGYKPAPLDLNHVKLTPNQNTLVERLAENGHNVWARDRVRQGWTYSIMQVLPVLFCFDLFFANGSL